MTDIGKMIVGIANAVQPNAKAQEWSLLLEIAMALISRADNYVEGHEMAEALYKVSNMLYDQAEKLAE